MTTAPGSDRPRRARTWRLTDRDLADPQDPGVLDLVHTEHISVAEAQHRMLVQSLAPALAVEFAHTLGADFAGSYIDDDGRLTICVRDASPATSEAVDHLASQLGFPQDVVVRQVAHSEAELREQAALVRRYLKERHPTASWSFSGSVATQTVSVHLDAPNVAELKAELETRYPDLIIDIRVGQASRT